MACAFIAAARATALGCLRTLVVGRSLGPRVRGIWGGCEGCLLGECECSISVSKSCVIP